MGCSKENRKEKEGDDSMKRRNGKTKWRKFVARKPLWWTIRRRMWRRVKENKISKQCLQIHHSKKLTSYSLHGL
jgi:hypothetical protein